MARQIKYQYAFTLVELFIVIGIIVVVSIIGFGNFGGQGDFRRVSLGVETLSSALEDVRNRSVSQLDGSPWGIRLVQPAAGISYYEIFKGTSYLGGTVEGRYNLPDGTAFSGFLPDSYRDITFDAKYGKASDPSVISIVSKKRRALVGTVSISKVGSVTNYVENNVVGMLHFDEGSGASLLDASTNENNITLSGAQWNTGTACANGSCLLFDGTNDYVQIDDSPLLRPKEITVEVWFSTQDKNRYQAILSKKDASDFAITMNYTNPLYVACQSNAICFQINLIGDASTQDNYIKVDYPVSNISNNTWHHIVGTYDRQTLKLYFDGKLVDTNSTAGEIYYTAQPLCIGSEAGSELGVPSCSDRGEEAGQGWFLGKIDEVRIYGQALTADEIFAHYIEAISVVSSGSPPPPPPPTPSVAWTTGSQGVNESFVSPITVQAQLSAPTGVAVTVPFSFGGTATQGTDYTFSPLSPLTIPAGSTSATVNVSMINDMLAEGYETIVFTMGTPTNANLGSPSTHTITIVDDDSVPDIPIIVYDDSLGTSWFNESWNSFIDFSNTSPVIQGIYSVNASSTSGWSAFKVKHSTVRWGPGIPVDLTGQNYIQFIAYGYTGGTPLHIYFENDVGSLFPGICFSGANSIPDGVWTTYSIPLSDLIPSGFSVDGIIFQIWTGVMHKWFIDDIKFSPDIVPGTPVGIPC